MRDFTVGVGDFWFGDRLDLDHSQPRRRRHRHRHGERHRRRWTMFVGFDADRAAFNSRLGHRDTGRHRGACPSDPTGFTDVSPSSFAAADIECIFALDITTYSPTDNVTREQMAAFLAGLWRIA